MLSCQNSEGLPAQLDLTNATTGDIIWTENGQLQQTAQGVWQDWQKQTYSIYVPLDNYSYQKTAQNIKVTLSALCQKTNGKWLESTLDITKLGWESHVENIDGVLTVQSVSG